jgi:predicted small integral membrane protein
MGTPTKNERPDSGERIMRTGKILLVFGMGVFLALAAFGNIAGPKGGFGAVQAAVGMETTFQVPGSMWRAVTSPVLIWLGLAGIVLGEIAGAVYCLWGAANMWSARVSSAAFNSAKSKALLGLTITAVLYFVGFHVIAGEWFLMWQSKEVNVLPDAFRNFASAILIMMWVSSPDD